MTRMLQDQEGLSIPDQKVLNDISAHGWHVVGVFARGDEKGPDWVFSIGLFHSFGHPEVIVLGLELQTCMNVVNEIGGQVRNGKKYTSGVEYSNVLQEPYRCVFREVDRSFHRDYVGYALWFYEDDPFPIVQCFWPDKDAKFAWEKGCNAHVRESQPLLFAPK